MVRTTAGDSGGFCHIKFIGRIIALGVRICYTVQDYTPGGVYD